MLDIQAVQYAILETDGSLSVFPYPKNRPASAKDAGIQVSTQHLPITIVNDGYLLKENLSLAGKDLSWVTQVLQTHKADIRSTLLLTVDQTDKIVFIPKEGSS